MAAGIAGYRPHRSTRACAAVKWLARMVRCPLAGYLGMADCFPGTHKPGVRFTAQTEFPGHPICFRSGRKPKQGAVRFHQTPRQADRVHGFAKQGRRAVYGAAALLRETVHPIRLARCLMEADGALLRFAAGPEADRMAREFGLRSEPNAWFVSPRETVRHAEIAGERTTYHTSQPFYGRTGPRGTVGAVARDASGHLAAATSTGGTPFRPEGRIGDTPLPGCGFFAGDGAAASATGWGEAISASLLCGRAVLDGRLAADAARGQIQDMYTRVAAPGGAGATGGLILLTARAGGAVAWSTPRMARAAWSAEGTSFLVVD